MGESLERALALLGPLEGRIMWIAWTGRVGGRFVVRDVQALMPELAYTTAMTTVRRLGRQRETADVVDRYGDAALAAFAAHLATLTPEQRRRLKDLAT